MLRGYVTRPFWTSLKFADLRDDLVYTFCHVLKPVYINGTGSW